MRLAAALPIAEEIRATLAPFCEPGRCEIAGSIRRRNTADPLHLYREVGDIEIVCIRRNRDLPAFVRAVEQWQKIKGSPTGAYTQRRHPSGMKVDIFMPHVDNWGLILAIRIGSERYSHHVLAKGWVRRGYESKGGMLRVRTKDGDGEVIPVREEHELFRMIGIPWVPPEERI